MDVTCELFVDGTRVADAPPLGLAPVALDGLSITWGRGSVAEQPDTSTCEFTVRDAGGGVHFRDLLHVGGVVEVFASGQVPQSAGQFGPDYVVDGSFETLTAGASPGHRVAVAGGSRVTVTGGGGSAGAKFLRLTSAGTASTVGVAVPPDTFTPEVGAWDHLPEAEPGTTQRFSVDVRSSVAAAPVVNGANAATNPNLEAGLSGWTSTSSASYPLTLTTTNPIAGTQSALITRAATPLNNAVAGVYVAPSTSLFGFDCVEAVDVFASVDVRAELAARRIGFTISWFNAANTLVSTTAVVYPITGTTAGQTYRLAFTGTPPAGAVRFRPNVYVYTVSGNATPDEKVWFDRLRVGGSATDTAYFDGSTPAGGGLAYRWTGAANASTSERVATGAVPGAQVTIQPQLRQSTGARGPNIGAPVVVTAGPAWSTITRDVSIPVATPPGWLAIELATTAATWATVDPAATWQAATTTWQQHAVVLDVDQLRLYPPDVTVRRVLVWSGRVSDLTASPLADVSGNTVRVLAVDSFADLANRYVGAVPWPAETMSARFARVLSAANPGPAITSVIDPAPAAMRVCSRDVDNASAGGLLAELATSTDAVLWWACHIGRGGYLWVEDPAIRTALEHLELVGGKWTVVSGPSANAPDPITLSACDVLAGPVAWQQSADEVATRVDVTWQEAGTPDNVERTYSVIDAPAEVAYGVHRYGVSTQLALLADATTVANRVLARAHTVDWRISGLVWDTDLPRDTTTATVNAAMDLLDGTHRLGVPIAVTDLPEWSPVGLNVGVYCEGGTWEYVAGRWVLAMNVTPAAPGAAITWAAAPPAWTWTTTDPPMTWSDLATVGA